MRCDVETLACFESRTGQFGPAPWQEDLKLKALAIPGFLTKTDGGGAQAFSELNGGKDHGRLLLHVLDSVLFASNRGARFCGELPSR